MVVAENRTVSLASLAVVTAAIVGWLARALWSLIGGASPPAGDVLPIVVASLVFCLLGALVLARVPGNRIGWVLSAPGLILLASGLASVASDAGHLVFLAIGGVAWFGSFIALGFLMLWFPTGSPVTTRWRWVGWLGCANIGLLLVLGLFAERLCIDGDAGACRRDVANPIGIPGMPDPEYGEVAPLFFGVLLTFIGASAVSLVVRFVRSRGSERLQLKWFALSVWLFVGAIVVGAVLEGLALLPWLGGLVFAVSLLGIPVSVTLAVTRYRLFEIDRIVSRTVSYTIVVGLLAGVYAGVWGLATRWLPLGSDLAVATSTLAAAALFTPVRRRVQAVVDRRFNRSRYRADRVVDEFGVRLRGGADLEMIPRHLEAVIRETLQPAVVGVWIREGGGPAP
ncbi:MAG: hypothetical protein R6X29_08665 [Acidimicrobiia bacterium]|jgi:hypothetical protein